MKLFPAKCHERATLRKQWIVHYYPWNVDRCCTWPEVAWCCRWNLSAFFRICSCFVLLYLTNYWSKAKWVLSNNPGPRLRLGDYSTIFTEPEGTNCFSIYIKFQNWTTENNGLKHKNTDAIVRLHTVCNQGVMRLQIGETLRGKKKINPVPLFCPCWLHSYLSSSSQKE